MSRSRWFDLPLLDVFEWRGGGEAEDDDEDDEDDDEEEEASRFLLLLLPLRLRFLSCSLRSRRLSSLRGIYEIDYNSNMSTRLNRPNSPSG